MIDNQTGKATRVILWPVRLDVAIKPSSVRTTKLMGGWVMAQLTEAAVRLWPAFAVTADEPPPPTKTLLPTPTRRDPNGPYIARWRRRALHPDDYDDDGGV